MYIYTQRGFYELTQAWLVISVSVPNKKNTPQLNVCTSIADRTNNFSQETTARKIEGYAPDGVCEGIDRVCPIGIHRQRDTTHDMFSCIRSCERVAQNLAKTQLKMFYFTQGSTGQWLNHQ